MINPDDWRKLEPVRNRGQELRRRREEAGFTREQIATEVGVWGVADVDRVEGEASMHPADYIRYVRALSHLASGI